MVTFVKEYENYILSENKVDIIKTLIPGSQSEAYLNMMNQIKKINEKNEITEDVIKRI